MSSLEKAIPDEASKQCRLIMRVKKKKATKRRTSNIAISNPITAMDKTCECLLEGKKVR